MKMTEKRKKLFIAPDIIEMEQPQNAKLQTELHGQTWNTDNIAASEYNFPDNVAASEYNEEV